MKEEEKVPLDWYHTFFERDYIIVDGDSFPPERTKREVDGLINILKLEKGSEILDLCCGQGRHSIVLAQQDFQVTGLDLSAYHIRLAHQSSESLGLDIRWLKRDMRDIPSELDGSFDAVINMFSAFGYLESVQEDIKVLKGVRRSLKPEGKFLMDIMNREWVIRNFRPKDWYYTPDGLLVLEERNLDLLTGRNHVHVHIVDKNGVKRTQGHAMRLYSLSEIASLYDSAGLAIQEVFGDFDKRKYGIDSPRMVILANRG